MCSCTKSTNKIVTEKEKYILAPKFTSVITLLPTLCVILIDYIYNTYILVWTWFKNRLSPQFKIYDAGQYRYLNHFYILQTFALSCLTAEIVKLVLACNIVSLVVNAHYKISAVKQLAKVCKIWIKKLKTYISSSKINVMFPNTVIVWYISFKNIAIKLLNSCTFKQVKTKIAAAHDGSHESISYHFAFLLQFQRYAMYYSTGKNVCFVISCF